MPAPTPPASPPVVPPTPDRSEGQDVFNVKAFNWNDWFAPFTAWLVTVLTYIQNAIGWVDSQALAASNSAISAAASDGSAAAAANFKGQWSALSGALNKPSTVLHKGAYWVLLNNLSDVTTSEPGVTADWAFSSGTRWRTPYTASGSLAANSQNSVIATSAQADMTLPVMAVNDFVVLHNDSTSTQTVRLMNSSYTIRGRTGAVTAGNNLIIARGDTVHLICKSTNNLEVV